jgi:hypothetical protein
VRRLLAGGLPGQGAVVEGVKGVKYTPMLPRMYKNGKKTGGFAHFLAYKLPKTLFFAQKFLTRYTPETFFKEYINFKIFCYFRHCGVIPILSFGSHIQPQPPELGLIHFEMNLQ